MRQRTISRVLAKTGLRTLLGRVLKWSGVLTLNYHRIGDGSRSVFDREIWSATAEDFDSQVRWLKSHFDVIGPDDLEGARARGTGRYVLITFDDGYRDNYTDAFQVLRRHRVPATFFVTTGFIDDPRLTWWDEIAWMVRTSRRTSVELPEWLPSPVVIDDPNRERAVRTLLRAYKAMPTASTDAYLRAVGEATGTGRYGTGAPDGLWMTWDMLREMRAGGMSVGGHTVNHPILARMSREQQREEIAGCGKRLAEELNEPMRLFSYPVGHLDAFNDDTRACLKEAGVRYAFSYYGGFRRFGEWDDYDIRRLAVEEFMPLTWVQARVALPQLFARA